MIAACFKTIILFICTNWLPLCALLDHSVFVTIIAALAFTVVFIYLNVKPTLRKYSTKRLLQLKCGSLILGMFLALCVFNIAFGAYYLVFSELSLGIRIASAVISVLSLLIMFINGIIRVYLTSVQLGITLRLIGIICGYIPVINIIVLVKIILVTNKEAEFEEEKLREDKIQAENHICKTRYPVVLVHGVFFRDIRFFNYWGRIPGALKRNGCEIYYGEQESAASVEVCGKQLAQRIRDIVEKTGCEKVNIIAHSKGGLDSRCAISGFGCADMVASLTTVNTPHRGCMFADYLLEKVPEKMRLAIANKYNSALKKLGDKEPDFLSAVNDLTASSCKGFNEKYHDSAEVYYQSIGSIMSKAQSGKFPLNLSYHLVKHFDGENDGLVSIEAMKWGEDFKTVNADGRYKRGISHGDVIDLNRENIDGFDVRAFYMDIIKELIEKGF